MPASTSVALSRCSSFSRRSLSNQSQPCILSPAPAKLLVLHLSPAKRNIPLEIIESIAHYAYHPHRSFKPLLGFAAASLPFHMIAMRLACTHLCVLSLKRWAIGMPQLENLALWVRTLRGASPAIAASEASVLKTFIHLTSVHITFTTETIANLERAILPVLSNLPSSLTELCLTDLPDANALVLSALANKFTALRKLELSCSERLDPACCWACFEESASRVWHSPIPEVSPNAAQLTSSLKYALRPLVHLQHLHLGFFLSPEEMFYEHIEHAQQINDQHEASNLTSQTSDTFAAADVAELALPFGPEWCIDCFEKYASNVRLVELQAALSLAQALKELQTVSWASFFGRQKQEMDERRTTIWVGRNNGHIRVRRRPF